MSRLERTGWRDEEISSRHRSWGMHCPAVDLDFLLIEYDSGTPAAVIEYKHRQCSSIDLSANSLRALSSLATASKIPCLVAVYYPGPWCFYVICVNAEAKALYKHDRFLSESRYVASLYYMRDRVRPSTGFSTEVPDGLPVPRITRP